MADLNSPLAPLQYLHVTDWVTSRAALEILLRQERATIVPFASCLASAAGVKAIEAAVEAPATYKALGIVVCSRGDWCLYVQVVFCGPLL